MLALPATLQDAGCTPKTELLLTNTNSAEIAAKACPQTPSELNGRNKPACVEADCVHAHALLAVLPLLHVEAPAVGCKRHRTPR